jgi:endonuclease/exonuclease/phosphatase family metal-dependent hydrolase
MYPARLFKFSRICISSLVLLLCTLVGANSWQSARTQPAPFLPAWVSSDDPSLLETGNYGPATKELTVPTEIKFVSYNIRWRGGEDLHRLIALLRNDAEIGGATVIGLQEVDRKRKRTNNVNTARLIAQELGLNYVWAAPPLPPNEDGNEKDLDEETGVAIFSPYPISDVERIVLPNPGPGGRRRAAVGATIHIGAHKVRAYSVHAETRVAMRKKMEQLQAVLDALAKRSDAERAVVMGDFNTIKGKDARACIKLFSERGFTTPIPHDRSTWKTLIIKLKLDWLWLRGFNATGHSIVRRIGFSDHWPLRVTVKL